MAELPGLEELGLGTGLDLGLGVGLDLSLGMGAELDFVDVDGGLEGSSAENSFCVSLLSPVSLRAKIQ